MHGSRRLDGVERGEQPADGALASVGILGQQTRMAPGEMERQPVKGEVTGRESGGEPCLQVGSGCWGNLVLDRPQVTLEVRSGGVPVNPLGLIR